MSKTVSRFVDFRAVKAAVSMEQVLSHYGVLNRFKRGPDSLSGPCPIHQGTNPSQFRISISKNCWHCFSDCKGGGNVLDFVARMEQVEPLEAAHRLVDWFSLDPTTLNTDRPTASKEAPVGKACDAPRVAPPVEKPTDSASAPSKELSPKEPVTNKPLRFQLELDPSHPYLTERGLTPETIREFGLGYAAKGVMAGRIAIPIRNVAGELVGYSGRWPGPPPDGRPKYRLPDGFRKAAEVYRLAEALREPSTNPLVVVEGFFDVMRLWQLGVRRCVALMGSSMSSQQEDLIVQLLPQGSKIIVMFDEDTAGREGRADTALRLSRQQYVRTVTFAAEGFQPENLQTDSLQTLNLT